jgi:hypothetical protein
VRGTPAILTRLGDADSTALKGVQGLRCVRCRQEAARTPCTGLRGNNPSCHFTLIQA